MKVKKILRKILLLHPNETLSTFNVIKAFHLKYGKIFYKQKYNTIDIINSIKELRITSGSNIFVHSAWDSFYNYDGDENSLIDALLDLIGPTGTILMPAFPLNRNKQFNVRRSVTGAGFLAECFRHYPGVKRSANIIHSVCAIGPLADYLTETHNKSQICFDEYSPFYKICLEANFKVLSLGLPPFYIGTIIHTIGATLYKTNSYFSKFYSNKLVEHEYISYNGTINKCHSLEQIKYARTEYLKQKYIVKRYFDKSKYGYVKLSNIYLSFFEAQYTYQKLKELADKGIVLYVTP